MGRRCMLLANTVLVICFGTFDNRDGHKVMACCVVEKVPQAGPFNGLRVYVDGTGSLQGFVTREYSMYSMYSM